MKTLTFNKSSWHYTIANFGGFDKWDDQDLCTYTRKFISGIFKSIIIAMAIALFGYGISDAILGIIFSIDELFFKVLKLISGGILSCSRSIMLYHLVLEALQLV